MAVKLCPSKLQCCASALRLSIVTGGSHCVGWHVKVARMSASCSLSKDPSTPPKSGDRGPHKNYRRKQAKKARMSNSGNSGIQLDSLLEGMKMVDLKEWELVNEDDKPPPTDLRQLLSGMRMSGSEVGEKPSERSEVSEKPSNCQFLDSTAGPRLSLFTSPRRGVRLMPPGRPTYAEVDAQKKLQALLLLKPWCYYDDEMEANRTPYPRQFPIDNENYNQGEERTVEFKDHVLLDHLLASFPRKGPVRHFMELVVTGLSKNPHYTAREKREVVQWYTDYFSQFTPEELDSMQIPS